MSTLRTISIVDIDASNRLRTINQAWVEALAGQLGDGVRLPPIEVVEQSNGGYRLIAGGHRLAAHSKALQTEIEAQVWSAEAFSDEAAIRLREIHENMMRFELTALDRSVHLATWKEIHEAAAPPVKKGRKSAADREKEMWQDSAAISAAPGTKKQAQDSAAIFAGRFSAAAAAALRISERSVQVAVQIASGIGPALRERIAAHDLADNASELLLLAAQSEDRQARIINLMLSEPPEATRVAEAIAILDKVQPPPRLAAIARLSEQFSRLKEVDQHAFFAAHAEAIESWMAGRRG